MAVEIPRRTKIVATLGPATSTPDQISALVDAGMDAARLNFSHGTHDQHRELAGRVREAGSRKESGLALIADLQGPKLRVGELAEPMRVARGDEVTVVAEEAARNGDLPISPAAIGEVLAPGHDVLIEDGRIRLRVLAIDEGRARCEVLAGGLVASHKGVNVPGVPVPIPALTRKDVDDLELALELGVDYVALSFVRSAADVRDLRQLIEQAGSPARVIAKIEKAEAVDALDAVLEETDAVMVASGDLGVEIGPASVPLLQKRIILRALELGKPVITATQMLESMIHALEPTRAEASDVANAILDGTVRDHALRRDGGRRVPGRVGAVHGPDRPRRRAEHRLPAPVSGAGRRSDRGPGDVECDLRSGRDSRRPGDHRPDLDRPHGLARRAPAPAPADHRADV